MILITDLSTELKQAEDLNLIILSDSENLNVTMDMIKIISSASNVETIIGADDISMVYKYGFLKGKNGDDSEIKVSVDAVKYPFLNQIANAQDGAKTKRCPKRTVKETEINERPRKKRQRKSIVSEEDTRERNKPDKKYIDAVKKCIVGEYTEEQYELMAEVIQNTSDPNIGLPTSAKAYLHDIYSDELMQKLQEAYKIVKKNK